MFKFKKKEQLHDYCRKYNGHESYYNVLMIDGKYTHVLGPGETLEYPYSKCANISQLLVKSKLYIFTWEGSRVMCASGHIKIAVCMHAAIDPARILDVLRSVHYRIDDTAKVEFEFEQFNTRIAQLTREWCSTRDEDYINQHRSELATHIKTQTQNYMGATGFILHDVFVVQDLTYGVED